MRFPKRARLSVKADYNRVFAQPDKSSDRYFTVLARGSEKGYARLGLAVSRKSAREASARNRIKRLIRESFRRHQRDLASVDVVVIARAAAAHQDNAALYRALQCHWRRLIS